MMFVTKIVALVTTLIILVTTRNIVTKIMMFVTKIVVVETAAIAIGSVIATKALEKTTEKVRETLLDKTGKFLILDKMERIV